MSPYNMVDLMSGCMALLLAVSGVRGSVPKLLKNLASDVNFFNIFKAIIDNKQFLTPT